MLRLPCPPSQDPRGEQCSGTACRHCPAPLRTAAPASEPTDPAAYDASADTDPSALTDFRETLTPYGSWEDDATYGVVWVPSASVVGDSFTPYVSDGHWALAEDGNWMWVSDFNWGWAPFHYGRWLWISGRGWGWIPGRVYSHAWVVWRTGYYDDYYVGWAPMPPTWYWRSGYAYGLYYVPPAPYVFCSSRYVFYPHVHSYIVPASRVSVIAPRTQPYVAAAATVGPTTTAALRSRAARRWATPTFPPATCRRSGSHRIDISPTRRPTAPSRERISRSVHTAAGAQRLHPALGAPGVQPSDDPPSVYYNRPAPVEIPRPVAPVRPPCDRRCRTTSRAPSRNTTCRVPRRNTTRRAPSRATTRLVPSRAIPPRRPCDRHPLRQRRRCASAVRHPFSAEIRRDAEV